MKDWKKKLSPKVYGATLWSTENLSSVLSKPLVYAIRNDWQIFVAGNADHPILEVGAEKHPGEAELHTSSKHTHFIGLA